MNSGIYCIENIVNQKRYVGASRNLTSRIYSHKTKLKRGKHDNPYLQASFNKYGLDNFKFTILERVEENQLAERELWWIEDMNTLDKDYGYNISTTPYGITPETKTISHKEAIGKACKMTTDAYYARIKEEGKLEVRVYCLIDGTYETFPSTIECPYFFKNKCKNFRIAKCKISTYNKTEEEMQNEYLKAASRYKVYLKSQESKPKKKKRDDPNWKHPDKYETIWTSSKEVHHFGCNDDAGRYFGIKSSSICCAVGNGRYTKTTFQLIKDNVVIDEDKNLKDMAKRNNHNYKAYKKVMCGERNSYLGFTLNRQDEIYIIKKV